MGYESLSDEDKVELSIKFVATGQPLPKVLVEFLKALGLYEAITQPVPTDVAA